MDGLGVPNGGPIKKIAQVDCGRRPAVAVDWVSDPGSAIRSGNCDLELDPTHARWRVDRVFSCSTMMYVLTEGPRLYRVL